MKNYRICGILGYNYIVFGLTQEDIDTGTSDYDTLTKKLLTGRCDLSVDRLEILLGFKAIGKNFISHPDFAYQVIPGEPTEPFHMMFSRNEIGRQLKQIGPIGIVDRDITYNKIHREATHMNWLHIGLIGAIVFTLHSFQQIKMTLKDKGHHVDLMTGWLDDYRRFKKLTLEEPDEEARYKYQRILNGLYLALAGLVFIPLLMIMGK